MRSSKVNMKKRSAIGIIISFLMILIGIIGLFVYDVNNFVIIILIGFAALISSLNIRAEKDRPKIRFAIGLFIVLALFSQAILLHNHYFAMGGFLAFIIFLVDYVKQSKHM
jgi:hypothetical protein